VDLVPAGGERALLHLDGDAGIVADALAQPGKSIEQGRFPGIRVSDQRDGERLGEHEFVSSRAA